MLAVVGSNGLLPALTADGAAVHILAHHALPRRKCSTDGVSRMACTMGSSGLADSLRRTRSTGVTTGFGSGGLRMTFVPMTLNASTSKLSSPPIAVFQVPFFFPFHGAAPRRRS